MRIKLSDYVFRFVADLGVKHVFMVSGGGAMHLNDSLGRCPDIEFVCNLHEQASAMAAETYSKATNNLGVALVTTGPGGTNAITGVAGAWQDSTPCLFISGQVKRADMTGNRGVRQYGLQEIDIVSLVNPITKYAVTIMDPVTIRYHLEKAVYLAKSGRPGPVWIDIPLDVQASMIDQESLGGFDKKEVEQPFAKNDLEEKAAKAIELLNESERPLFLAGNGIRLAQAEGNFLRLIDRLGIPVETTWLAIDILPNSHPLFVGRPGSVAPRGANFALQNSDWLLTVGARLDTVLTGYAPDKLARTAKKIMVDIDPAEIRKMGAIIDVSVCTDAKSFILEFLKQSDRIKPKDRSAWMARCQEWKTKYPVILPEYRAQKGCVSTYYLSEILSEELKSDDLIVSGSSGAGIEIFLLVLKVKAGQRIFHTTALGPMGNGLPSTIGACLGGGRRRTVAVDGDGGFQLNIQELETVARLKLPIKFFVLNNQGYSSIRTSQHRYFGRLTGADATSGLTLPDIVKVASAYDLTTMRIVDQTDLREKIRAVLKSPGPVICDVMVAPDEPRAPSLSSMQRPDGSMVSKPLEDLWPFLDRQEFLTNMIIPPLDE